MSNVLVEAAATDIRSDVAPDSFRIVEPATTEVAAGPQPAFGTPSAVRLSAELVAVIAVWMQQPRWRHGVSPILPEYRRHLP